MTPKQVVMGANTYKALTECPHTGLARPECCCMACIRQLLDRYYVPKQQEARDD